MGRTASCLGCVVLLNLVWCTTGVRAQERTVPPRAMPPGIAPSHSPSGDVSGTGSYVVEELRSKFRFEADGRGYRDETMRVRVQSEAAVRDFGVLVYPFASSFESLNIAYVRVHKPDGTVVETPPSEFQELDSAVSREAPMYTDQREKHIAVRSLSVGDVLEANLRWTVHDPVVPGKFWLDHSYFVAGKCLKEILEVDVPADLAVKMRHSPPDPEVRDEGKRRIYRFETSHDKPLEESKIPDWEKNYHGIEPPDVQFSSFSSWDEVGRWFAGLLESKIEATPELKNKSEELTKGKSSDEERIRAIYDFVSTRFRYIGIDLGAGRYTPHSASDVLANRYGDCKDKHTLFAALLRSAGIQASAALISSKFRIDGEFPSPSLFDHVITAVPRGSEFLFLDTTPEVAPFGLLMSNLRSRQVLLVTPGAGSRLVTTPPDPPTGNYETFRIESSIDVKGTLKAKMRMEDRGDSEVALRAAYRSTAPDHWQDLTQLLVARMGFGGTVSNVSVAQPEDTAQPFWITFEYTRADFPDWKSGRIVLPTPPFFLVELNEQQKALTNPLPLGSPEEVTYDSSVVFPDGFTPVTPENVEKKDEFAEFSAAYSVEKNTLHGTLHLKTLQNEIRGTKRTEFSSMTKLVDETVRQYIFVRGKQLYNYASLFFPGKLPAAAIPRLEEALTTDPNNDALLVRLSQAYRENGRATDAVAILQKAIASQEDVPPHLFLALGLSYLRVPETEKAINAFKKGLGDDAEPRDLNEVAYALAEAKADLGEASEYSTRAVSTLSSRTMDISLERVDQRDFALMTDLAANWDTLGWIKFQMGDFASAQKYLAAAWDVMQSSTIGEHLVEAYEKLDQKEKAAAICNMASAMRFPDADKGLTDKLSEEMARLQPYVKKRAGFGGRLSPVDGHVALTDLRMFQVPFHGRIPGKSASAKFLISLSNGLKTNKVEKVVFLSGAAELRGTSSAISAVKYPQSFPDSTPVRVIRMATLNCNIYSQDCTVIVVPSDEAQSPLSDAPVFSITPDAH